MNYPQFRKLNVEGSEMFFIHFLVDLEVAASLLNVDEYQLSDGLTLKTRSLRGEVIATPLDVQQVG